MSESLRLLPCPFLKKELEEILNKECYAEMALSFGQDENTFSSDKIVTFSDNLKSLRFGCVSNIINIKKIFHAHHECIDLLIGKGLSEKLTKKGHQLLTPSMLKQINQALEKGSTKEHFLNLTNVLIIDTGVHPQLADEIKKLESNLEIKINTHKITLDFLEQNLELHLEIWRQFQNTALLNENLFYTQKEKANYAIILDFICRIQNLDTEKKILENLLDLVVMMAGTNDVHFFLKNKNIFSFSTPPDDLLQQQLTEWSDDEKKVEAPWIAYPIKYHDEKLGTLFIKSDETKKIEAINILLLTLMNFSGLALDKLHNMNQLAQQKEFEAIHAMVATYNHEINNPLSIAIGYLNIMEKKQDFKYLPDIKDSLIKIERIVEKISEITNKNLDFANYSKESQRLKID